MLLLMMPLTETYQCDAGQETLDSSLCKLRGLVTLEHTIDVTPRTRSMGTPKVVDIFQV
jgi:hypothetical protein